MPPVGGKTVKPRLRHRSGDLLESPFMCRPGTNFARLGDPLQGLHMGNGGADIFLDHSGSTYIIPKLSLYSTGLMPPKVILIRSSLYQ